MASCKGFLREFKFIHLKTAALPGAN